MQASAPAALDIRFLGRVDYACAVAAMQSMTAARGPHTPDALWLCEHPPTFTQGLAGKAEHVLTAGSIPVVATNRGGQVTYHGPGQVVAYPLLDFQRRGYFVKEYVHRLEEATIRTLAQRRAAARLHRPGQDRGTGHQGQPPLQLPRFGTERGDGFGAFPAHPSLRLFGFGHGRYAPLWRGNRLGRRGGGTGPAAASFIKLIAGCALFELINYCFNQKLR